MCMNVVLLLGVLAQEPLLGSLVLPLCMYYHSYMKGDIKYHSSKDRVVQGTIRVSEQT